MDSIITSLTVHPLFLDRDFIGANFILRDEEILSLPVIFFFPSVIMLTSRVENTD
jgi:hypothetical protein